MSRLLTKDVAEMVGLKESTIRRYRIRGTFPEPDGHDFGHPWWTEETVRDWQAERLLKKDWGDKWEELDDVTESRRSAVPAPGSSVSGSTAPGKESRGGSNAP